MNPWLIVGFLVALIAIGVGGYLKGETDGKTATEAVWQTREAKINADAANKIAEADRRVADAEHASADRQAAIDSTYQSKLKEKDHALTVALNTVKSTGLFVHTAPSAPATGNGMPETATSPGSGNAAPTARLSDEDAGFLLAEASRADGIVAQLTACQAIVEADRK